MQEPQYKSPGVRELLDRVAKSGKPCMSIMNMPPLPYLARLPGIDASTLRHCYADATVWDGFDPKNMNWEDLDLGWRTRRAGWQAIFVPEALVFHQVMPLSLLEWLKWPLYFQYMPAKAARYPEYRRFYF